MRIVAFIVGVVIAAIGGVIAYRALFVEPTSAVLITNAEVRELPNTFRVLSGLVLLVIGAIIAFLGLRRRST